MGNQPSAAGSASSSAGPASSDVNYTSTQANGTGTQTQARRPAATAVILNIYEPTKSQGQMPGFGIYHTGIEFSGVEYSFAGGPDAGSGTGVMSQQPRATPAGGEWKFKQALELGSVHVTNAEFERTLQELKDAFPANTYDLVHRNCNSFTTAVAKRLGVGGKYPSWVNRAASWGAVFSSPPKHLQPLPEQKPKESVFKSTTGYRVDGGAVVQPKGAKGEQKKAESEQKKSSGSASSAGKPRANPWADPAHLAKISKDPVVVTGKIDA